MNIRGAQNFSDLVVDALFAEKERRGISNYKIAKDCGISEAALSYIKHHKTRPTLYTLKLISDAIEVDLSYFVIAVEKKSRS